MATGTWACGGCTFLNSVGAAACEGLMRASSVVIRNKPLLVRAVCAAPAPAAAMSSSPRKPKPAAASEHLKAEPRVPAVIEFYGERNAYGEFSNFHRV
jgi:hypothetical protein